MKGEYEYQEEIMPTIALYKVSEIKAISGWEVDSKTEINSNYTKVILKRKIQQ